MRQLPLLVAVIVFTSCARTVNVEQEKAALMALDAEWAKTSKDLEKYMSFFAPDATFSMPGMPAMKGTQAIRQGVAPIVKDPNLNLTWTATRAEVSTSGDVGYTSGTYEVTQKNAAGVTASEKGKYLDIWKKFDGVWKAIESIGNADTPPPSLSSAQVVVPASKLVWVDAPPTLPPGAKLALVSGDPSQPGPFTVRVQFQAGSRVAPHWHPNDEHVTVLAGTIALGLGTTFDVHAMTDLTAGSYAVTPATMPHYALAKTAATFQVHGIGPYVANRVSEADDPPKK